MKFEQNWPRGSREVFNSEYFSHTNALGSKKEVKCQCSNFGRPLVSDDISKGSAIRHPRFWRTISLKVFPIQMHREANFDFDIVNFPFMDDDVPRCTSYGYTYLNL